MKYFLGIAAQENMTNEIIAARCERGADIARRLGFPDGAVKAIHSLDEHWNGEGYPAGAQGDDIPLLSRILNVAQTAEVFLARDGVDAAVAVLTYAHSTNVATYACAIGEKLGFDAAAQQRTRRAGLLHDVGKVGVSNRILGKNGPLDADERVAVERHPAYTWDILGRVSQRVSQGLPMARACCTLLTPSPNPPHDRT